MIEKNAIKRIGLLGGSFNPAHEGHLHITRLALDRLGLDQVWWMVSPQNPLKPPEGMAPLSSRLREAEALVDDARVVVTDIERQLGTHYSVDTLRALKNRHPDTRFVWVMGADNLIRFWRWKEWRAIFRCVPIAVFARPSYSFRALKAKAARRFAGAMVRETRAASLADMTPPAWVFMRTMTNPASSTLIRGRRGL